MSRETARQQERACASFDCAPSRSATSTSSQQQRKSIFQRCVLILLVQSLLLGPVHAAPPAVVEPAATSTHALATTIGLSVGNPILPATAEKFQSETDFTDAGPAPLSFGRFYRSTWGADTSRPAGVLGTAWTHTYSASLRASPALNPVAVTLTSAEGYVRTFAQPAGASSWSATNSADSLTWTPAAWIYRRADDDSTSHFDTTTGKLLSRTARNGWTTRYTYDAVARLSTITNAFGRTLSLAYNSAGLLSTVTTPDGRSIGYAYDASGRLCQVSYPDGKTRSYLYENAAFPRALTGIVDEAGARLSTYAYDAQGRAVSTERAGGVDRYQVSYPAAGTATVTDPLGISRTYTYSTTLGKLAVTGGSLPSATGEADAAARVQDANGLIASETDFKGITRSTTWDAARRLPISVERAAGTPAAQTVTTQWHPTFSLPVLVTEAGRTTSWTYDEQGNALSSTLTDTASGKVQRWQWSYTAQSQVATETAPNGAITSYAYDPLGNMTQSVNALGHVTQYSYDAANRVVSETAPNGLLTAYTYDLRDRLLTKTVGGQPATALTYTATGLVETLTLPTGLVLRYTYDAAHRLTGWSNNRGESGSYTLDAMGNRVGEQISNSTGAIAWSTARSINNLNRVAARTEGSNQTDSFDYDANGELVSETNGLNQSTRYGLDPLRRVAAITNAANATAALSYNALDAVTQASDFKGVATTYGRDAQGNATTETSADIGTRVTQYDALGLPSRIVDALGQATAIERDGLGRPTLITFADGRTTTLRYDLGATSTGYLFEIVDRSGTTTYSRDEFGRVIAKTQTLASGLSQQVTYAYTAAGQLASIGYPDGSVLAYQYEATGRMVQLSRNRRPLITDIAWNPMGQPTAWRWSFASNLDASRSYDLAGRLTATEFASYVYDAAGRITSLTQKLLQPGDSDPTHSSIASADVTWNVRYDAAGRITGFDAPGNATSFSYDSNGNRTGSTRTVQGRTTAREYVVDGFSNKLMAFQQTAGTASTSVVYEYNAKGDMTGDGLRRYSYDAEGRLSAATTGATDSSPTTRYAHNALGQRVFKTEPLFPPAEGDENDPGFFQGLISFFTKRWGPSTADAEKLGFAFMYDEDGTLLAETGMGGANSAGSTQYIYLPTANGPMPIAAVINGQIYAVHSDHLNTPRRLSDSQGQAGWQWSYSAFGDEKPTTAKYRFTNMDLNPNPGATGIAETVFNLRWPGQYYDKESGLLYNYFRSYIPTTGRYSQPDPIGLDGGWNRFGYVSGNPLLFTDPQGLQAVPTPFGPVPLPVIPPPSPGNSGGYDPVSDLFNPNMSRARSWSSWPPFDPSQPGPTGGDGGKCDKQYARDSAICRGLPTETIRAQCWKSAADRLAACVAGKNPPDLACP